MAAIREEKPLLVGDLEVRGAQFVTLNSVCACVCLVAMWWLAW